eukprot:gene10280-biopygen15525
MLGGSGGVGKLCGPHTTSPHRVRPTQLTTPPLHGGCRGEMLGGRC